MKVLEKGRPQKGWSVEEKCSGAGNGNGGCGARLLVEQGDVFTTYSNSMGRDPTWYFTFECPECGVLTDIDQPPAHVREAAQNHPKATKDDR
jgi:hypothetical protein